MTVTINAVASTGLVQTSDGSGVLKVQSNGVTTNALAWVNFDGPTGTRNSSYNVTSVTRSAVGTYTINYSNALADANYAPVAQIVAFGAAFGASAIASSFVSAMTTTSTTLLVGYSSGGSLLAANDYTKIAFAVFGN